MERQPRRRRRLALACLTCRRRKIKCDRSDPCAHCVAAKTECAYELFRSDPPIRQQTRRTRSWRSTSSPSVYAASPPPPPAQAQPTGVSRPTTGHVRHPLDPSLAMATGGQATLRSNSAQQGAAPDFRDLLRRIQKLDGSSASSPIQGLSETNRDILARQSGLQDSQIILDKSRILRWSHWVGTAKEFATIVNCYMESTGSGDGSSYQGAETKALVVEIGELMQKCKSMAKSIKVGRPSRCLSSGAQANLTPPSRETSDKMVAMYFRSFESTYRILHIPSFWAEYQKYWDSPETATNDIRLKILLVIGIGSGLCDHGDIDDDFRNTVHRWVYTAQMWLSGPLEKDRLGITGLQIYCLTILAREVFSIGADLVWMSMGSLIHRAMQIGLHRDPKHLPQMTVLQAELRRRLWATILEMTVQSSLDSAMPPRISFDEFDTEPPSNMNDDEITESATTEVQPHPKGTYTSTSIQLILLDSLQTRLRILRLLNGLNSELSYVDVLALSSEITDAFRACSMFMSENENSGVTPFHRNLLDYLVRRFLIPLHCPFASQARTNPLFHYSLKISLDVAMSIISPEPDDGFSHVMVIAGGLFREGIRYAISIISLELLAQVESQRLDGTLRRNLHYRNLLKQAVEDMISLSVERIRQGETNIKGYMFLRMIMAQAEAIEAGTDCEFSIAKGGKDGLQFCLELLEARASALSETGFISTNFDDGGHNDYGLDLDLEFFLPDTYFSSIT